MNRFVIAAVLGAVLCSTFAAAAAEPVPAPRVDIGSSPQLNDVSGLVNKNTVLKNNNVAITSSSVATVSDDTISLEQADGNLPPGVFLTGEQEPITESDKEALVAVGGGDLEQLSRRYRRVLFCYRRGPNTLCGWRYPMDYWFSRGRFIQGGSCGFGQAFGAFYYC